jgi:hypothetical protein
VPVVQERLPERQVDQHAAEGADRTGDADQRARHPQRLSVGRLGVPAVRDVSLTAADPLW